jgi:poly(A) polymerase
MEPVGKIEQQSWMTAPETRAVLAALGAEGAEPRFVGGCVRDAVIGRPVKDVDIATPDPPDRVLALIERAGLKAVPTGLAHGTVTAVSRGRPFEVTSLRIDVETYGRHAKVVFTDDWKADAARRDLTINTLSCTPDGRLFDYFGALEDLRAGRVRFVGDPRKRIREDYLRLLRFFRFHAHYGRGAPDPDGLAAACELAPEAATLSGERVRAELLRLLAAPDPVAVLDLMAAGSVLNVFLPDARDTASLAALLEIEPDGAAPDALFRLAALLPPDLAVGRKVAKRLRLSRAEQSHLVSLLELPGAAPGAGEKALRVALYRQGAAVLAEQWRLGWARLEASERAARRPDLDAALAVAARWQPVSFPLKGRDATARRVPAGPRVGQLLAAVEAWWIAEDFAPDRAACLAKLEELARP